MKMKLFKKKFNACTWRTLQAICACLQVAVGLHGSGSGLYSGGLTWNIVLRCDDHTGIFTCDGCSRDPYFYVPAETQSYVIKLSCSRKVLAASGD